MCTPTLKIRLRCRLLLDHIIPHHNLETQSTTSLLKPWSVMTAAVNNNRKLFVFLMSHKRITYIRYKHPLIQNLKWFSIQLLTVTNVGTYWQHIGASKAKIIEPINLTCKTKTHFSLSEKRTTLFPRYRYKKCAFWWNRKFFILAKTFLINNSLPSLTVCGARFFLTTNKFLQRWKQGYALLQHVWVNWFQREKDSTQCWQ